MPFGHLTGFDPSTAHCNPRGRLSRATAATLGKTLRPLLLAAVCLLSPEGSLARDPSAIPHSSVPQRSRDVHALREACLKDLENARRNQQCLPFLPPASENAPRRSQNLDHCDTPKLECGCAPNSVDVICTYRLCGFTGGSYSHPDLIFLAARIRDGLLAWADASSLPEFSTSFIGYADGMDWRDGSLPQPQPIQPDLAACLRNAVTIHQIDFSAYSRRDRRDIEVAPPPRVCA